ncbi:MAG TPA: glycosyltransferase family 2 protein [Planctomycetes bacterium]|nr:glycosyltransferase family 2 protein [Planctomycetota bacterium]
MNSTSPTAAPRVALVLPARNEEEPLPLVLGEVPEGRVDVIVVCDNGSTDRTAEVARRAGAVVVSEPTPGYGRACLAGLDFLFGRGPDAGLSPPLGEGDIVCFLDADHSDYPEELPLLVDPLLEGRADFVIGSRVLGGADMSALLPQAWFGNRLACFLMRALFGARYTDLGPFRALTVAALRTLEMGDKDFGWTIEMQLKAHAHRLRVLEVPVRYRPRIGHSKITGTVSGSLRAGAKILGWIFAWRLKTWFSAPGERPRGSDSRSR